MPRTPVTRLSVVKLLSLKTNILREKIKLKKIQCNDCVQDSRTAVFPFTCDLCFTLNPWIELKGRSCLSGLEVFSKLSERPYFVSSGPSSPTHHFNFIPRLYFIPGTLSLFEYSCFLYFYIFRTIKKYTLLSNLL